MAVLVASILTIVAAVPALIEFLAHSSLEVAFVYGVRTTPFIDPFVYTAVDFALLYGCLVAGFGVIKRKKWAWFLAIGLNIAILAIHVVANFAVAQDDAGQRIIFDSYYATSRIVTLIIGSLALVFLFTKNVRSFVAYKA
jgi:hypothetical protein